MKTQTVYIPIPVSERLPKESSKVGILRNTVLDKEHEFDFAYAMIPNEERKHFIFDHHRSGLSYKQTDITHWLEETPEQVVMSKDDFKKILNSIFYAGEEKAIYGGVGFEHEFNRLFND